MTNQTTLRSQVWSAVFDVTQSSDIADKAAERFNEIRNEGSKRASVPVEVKREIEHYLARGKHSYAYIATYFGVGMSTVQRVANELRVKRKNGVKVYPPARERIRVQ